MSLITGNFFQDILSVLYRGDSFTATEYCTTEYSNKDFKLIKHSKDLWKQYGTVKEQKELKWIEAK